MVVLNVAAAIAVLAAGIAGLIYFGQIARKFIGFVRRVSRLLDDWLGEPARGDQPARLGVIETLASVQETIAQFDQRLGKVEAELSPNGGRSVKDVVGQIATATGATIPTPPASGRHHPRRRRSR